MDSQQITLRVRESYWQHDFNCATTTLRILAECSGIEFSPQVFDAAVGMHGAGGYRAQCSLVEGTLMFLGILGRAKGLADQEIIQLCCRYAENFEEQFSSVLCRELRPEGFGSDQPPHLCAGQSRSVRPLSMNT